MAATRLRKRPSKTALGVGVSILLAVAIAGLAHVLVPASPSSGRSSSEQRYTIDPKTLALTASDVGKSFTLVGEGHLPPTQMGVAGTIPYQQQYNDGWLRNFMVNSALSGIGRAEIENYQKAHGFEVKYPPTIFGPFVTDHTGIFEITDAEQSYHVASAAHLDYLCCGQGGYADNWDGWHTLPIKLGDETFAWTGIRDSPTNPGDDYEELAFVIRWQRGPIVSTMWILGAHDITFDQDLAFARIVDARIVSALQQAPKGAFHASNPRTLAAASPCVLAVCDLDRRARQRLDRA